MPRITQSVTETIQDEQGNVKEKKQTKVINYGGEPEYVKVYLDYVLFFKSLPKAYNPILMGLLRYMSWADKGQMIYLNAALKRKIAAEIGVSKTRIDHAITDFVKGKVLFRMDVGAYQFNAKFFGRGDWDDIAEIQATITFNPEGTDFTAEITKADERTANRAIREEAEKIRKETAAADPVPTTPATDEEKVEAQGQQPMICKHCGGTEVIYKADGQYGPWYKCKTCGKGTSAERKSA